jgi:hypothetical protein
MMQVRKQEVMGPRSSDTVTDASAPRDSHDFVTAGHMVTANIYPLGNRETVPSRRSVVNKLYDKIMRTEGII